MSQPDLPAQRETVQCPKAGHSGKHGPAQEPHTCPFAVEINDDETSLCTCCKECTHECAMDI